MQMFCVDNCVILISSGGALHLLRSCLGCSFIRAPGAMDVLDGGC